MIKKFGGCVNSVTNGRHLYTVEYQIMDAQSVPKVKKHLSLSKQFTFIFIKNILMLSTATKVLTLNLTYSFLRL